MNPTRSPLALDKQVSALIESLHETERRLEKLTGGEVDAVADRDGRAFLLRRAQDQLRESGAAKEAAILNAVPAQIALLDANGIITSVNESWRRFGTANPIQGPGHEIGLNYLEICESARGDGASEAHQVAKGVRSVLYGGTKHFAIEYPCPSSPEERWVLLTATPLADDRPNGAVVMHVNITERKHREDELLRFGGAMDAISDAIYLVDRSSMSFIHVNEAACRMQNRTREEVLAMGPAELLSIAQPELERRYDAVIAAGAAEPEEALRRREDGSPVWVEIRRHAQRSGDRWLIVTLVRDITERKEAEEKIRRLNRVYAVLSGINTLIVRAGDRDELFREACRIAVEAGAFRMAWIGVVDRIAMKIVPVASAGAEPEFLKLIEDRFSLREDAPMSNTMTARAVREKKAFMSNEIRGDLRVLFAKERIERGISSMAILPLLVSDDALGVLALYANEPGFFDEEEMKLLTELAGNIAFAMDHVDKRERLDYLAHYDSTTGLANRSLFLGRLQEKLLSARDNQRKKAVFVVDIERFKAINDAFGRQAGDELLKQIAARLVHSAGGDATRFARIEADRFAILERDMDNVEDVGRYIEQRLDAPFREQFRIGDSDLRVSIKVGIALFPDDGADADTLFRNAEAALKKAKGSGERYLFFTQAMTERVAERLSMENRLRRALDHEEFVLHYQPTVNLASGKVTGAEALIRWNDPRSGLVPPGRFIPILEETGLIHEVGRWALRKAIEDYLRWCTAGLAAVRIAVNVSSLQLGSRGFIDEVTQAVGIDARAAAGLELEITESMIMADVKQCIATLQAIRALGVRIAIDDFGTGFSSLGYLSKLPVDTLKIDRSFVTDMTASQPGLTLVSTIINLAHSLRLRVVAEGVETEEQSRLLRLLNCDEMQGFLFSRPLPCEIFEAKYLAPSSAVDG